MKKLALVILLFLAVIVAVISCSTDKINVDPEEVHLLKIKNFQLMAADSMDNFESKSSYTYNGFKVEKIESSDGITTYTYTGDLITKKEIVTGEYMNSTEYIYEDGKLKSVLVKTNNGSGTTLNYSYKFDYIYNSDGTVTVQNYSYLNEGFSATGSTVFIFQNGNVVKTERFDKSGTKVGECIYEYDTKKNPEKGILGFEKILQSKNNVLKSTDFSYRDVNTGVYHKTNVTASNYTYDDQSYPISVQSEVVETLSSEGGSFTQTEHIAIQYEY